MPNFQNDWSLNRWTIMSHGSKHHFLFQIWIQYVFNSLNEQTSRDEKTPSNLIIHRITKRKSGEKRLLFASWNVEHLKYGPKILLLTIIVLLQIYKKNYIYSSFLSRTSAIVRCFTRNMVNVSHTLILVETSKSRWHWDYYIIINKQTRHAMPNPILETHKPATHFEKECEIY